MKSLRESSAALVQDLVQNRPEMRLAIDRENLVQVGKLLWTRTYKETPDDTEAFRRFCAFAEMLIGGLQSPNEEERISGTLASAMLFLPMQQMTYFWACRWADQAFPVITMGHKYAASLMSTSIAPELIAEVIPPYKSFLVEVPDKLLEIEDPKTKELVSARYVLAQYLQTDQGRSWNYVVLTNGPISIWRHGIPTEALAEVDPNTTTWNQYSFALENTDRDERIHVMIGRLLVGSCLALSSKDTSKPIGKNHQASDGSIRTSLDPLVRTFQIGKPVKIDCRQAVQEYITGVSRSAPGVQKLLRGHWQRYHYGPKEASIAKWTHKEPYWRGPEKAPILVSSLDLGQE